MWSQESMFVLAMAGCAAFAMLVRYLANRSHQAPVDDKQTDDDAAIW